MKFSSLGMDEPGDAATSPSPELEKESDATALEVRPDTTTIAESLVLEETPAPARPRATGLRTWHRIF
jgi:hypothetical protein